MKSSSVFAKSKQPTNNKLYVSFNETGIHITSKNISDLSTNGFDYPIPHWKEMSIAEKAQTAAEFEGILVNDAKKAGVSFEVRRRMTRQERRRLEREFREIGAGVETVLASMLRNRILNRAEEMVAKLRETGNETTVSQFKTDMESTSNREIISSYLTCSECGSEFLSYHDAIEMAKESRNLDEWFSMIDHARSSHEI
jgi:hypothetical protein